MRTLVEFAQFQNNIPINLRRRQKYDRSGLSLNRRGGRIVSGVLNLQKKISFVAERLSGVNWCCQEDLYVFKFQVVPFLKNKLLLNVNTDKIY